MPCILTGHYVRIGYSLFAVTDKSREDVKKFSVKKLKTMCNMRTSDLINLARAPRYQLGGKKCHQSFDFHDIA